MEITQEFVPFSHSVQLACFVETALLCYQTRTTELLQLFQSMYSSAVIQPRTLHSDFACDTSVWSLYSSPWPTQLLSPHRIVRCPLSSSYQQRINNIFDLPMSIPGDIYWCNLTPGWLFSGRSPVVWCLPASESGSAGSPDFCSAPISTHHPDFWFHSVSYAITRKLAQQNKSGEGSQVCMESSRNGDLERQKISTLSDQMQTNQLCLQPIKGPTIDR